MVVILIYFPCHRSINLPQLLLKLLESQFKQRRVQTYVKNLWNGVSCTAYIVKFGSRGQTGTKIGGKYKEWKTFGCLVFNVITAGFWWGNLRERNHFGDPGVDGRVILRLIFKKWNVEVWTGSNWLRIGTGGENLWMRYWTYGFHKMRGIPWLAESRLTSQEEHCSME